MKKKIKFALMGVSAAAIVAMTVGSVVSCAEITKNAASNQYLAFAANANAFGTQGALNNSQINDIVMGNKSSIFNKDNFTSGEYNTNTPMPITSVASWKYSDTGQTQLIPMYNNGLSNIKGSDIKGAPSSIANQYYSLPTWLATDNQALVSNLFTNVLNYLVGAITVLDYVGQQAKMQSDYAEGILRRYLSMVDANNNNSNLYNVNHQNEMLGSENKVYIGSFCHDLLTGFQSPGMQTSYYLFPTDIFYSIKAPNNTQNLLLDSNQSVLLPKYVPPATKSTKQTTTNSSKASTVVLSSSKTSTSSSEKKTPPPYTTTFSAISSKLSNILAAYMPQYNRQSIMGTAKGNAMTFSTTPNEGAGIVAPKVTNYTNYVTSTVQLTNIKVVFDFYCSSSNYKYYTSDSPINATTTKVVNGVDDIANPQINGQNLSYNPFYGRYFVMNINPIDVNLANIGGTASQLGIKLKKGQTLTTAQQQDIDNYRNYAVLNWTTGANINLSANYSHDNNLKYTLMDQNNPLVFYDNENKIPKTYVKQAEIQANSWCFADSNDTLLNNLYDMQNAIANQIAFFQSVAYPQNGLLSNQQQSTILNYLTNQNNDNGVQTYQQFIPQAKTTTSISKK